MFWAKTCAFLLGLVVCIAVGQKVTRADQEQRLSDADRERAHVTLATYLNPESLKPNPKVGFSAIAYTGQYVGGAQTGESIAAQPEQRIHVVAVGETLGEIAERYNLRSGSIVLNNQAIENADSIFPGQELVIPEQDATQAELDKEQARRSDIRKKAQQKALAAGVAVARGTASKSSFKFLTPATYKYISQSYSGGHRGIDFVMGQGTPVKAVGNGCLIDVASGYNGGYGKMIVLDLGSGYTALYGHLSGFANYRAGDCVDAGTVIGYSGNTGHSTGPHLHFEIRRNGVHINPASLLP